MHTTYRRISIAYSKFDASVEALAPESKSKDNATVGKATYIHFFVFCTSARSVGSHRQDLFLEKDCCGQVAVTTRLNRVPI